MLPLALLALARALLLLAVAGIAVFFAPWLSEQAPEIRTLSGFAFARKLPWLWGAWVGWFIMLGLVASRRTVRQMRGARLAVMIMASFVLATVLMRIALTPTPHPLVARRYGWGWGLYSCGFLALIALVQGYRFGGSLEDMTTEQARPGDETLH